jgi:uncharacterized membrane protein
MFRFTFYPIAESYYLVAAVAAVLLALLMIGPGRRTLTPRKRAALLALRAAVILLLILAMLRPTIVYTESKKQPATLVVMVDGTRSMTVGDMAAGKTRWEDLGRAVSDATPALTRLAADFELKASLFDGQTRPLKVDGGAIELPETPTGTQTAIGAALDDVLRQEAGKRLLGIVLLSDGAQRALAPRDVAPQVVASRLKSLGAPLYTFPFGQSRGLGQARDVAVNEMLANATVFVKNELDVSGQIRVDGYVNREVPVRLLFETAPGKMEVVAEQRAVASVDGQLLPVEMQYVPEVPGEYKVTLEAVPQPGELVTTNNTLSTFVNVMKGGLNVLYIEGTRRVEARFIRRALDASPDVRVDYLWIDAQREATRPSDLADRFKPGKYDVYILGDIDSTAFRQEELQALAAAVDRGAGLIMLGGFHSFGPGNYHRTPLRDVLPVRFDVLERQAFDSPIDTKLHVEGPIAFRPTPLGMMHFSLNLGRSREESAAAWGKLSPLDGANLFSGVAPGAVVLADDGNNRPLLASHTYGAGRVMALGVDSTWRWWMRGQPSSHKRFWRQIVLWLAKRDQVIEGNVWVRLDKRRFGPAERVEFRVGAQAPDGELLSDADFDVQIVMPDGARRPLRLVRQGDESIGSFRDTQAAGDYAIELTAQHAGQTLGSARARFLVYEQDLELDNASADPATLQTLAAMTGGQSLAPEQLPDLIDQLIEQSVELEVQQETKRSLWDKWPFFLLLVGLLGVEWYLRKRWGLV